MSDQVQGSVTGGNGERLELTLAGRSFGLQTKDMVTVLLLLMLGAGGYLLYDAVSKDLRRLDRQHEQILTALQQNLVRIVEAIQQANQHRDAQTEAIRKMLLLHEVNQSREPGDRVPLELAPETLSQPQKGR